MTTPDPKPAAKAESKDEPIDTDENEPIDLERPIEEGDANAQTV